MDTVKLTAFDLETTSVGFGCARLFREPSRRRRQAVLGAAFDAGIKHFDVARMYGLGEAESELGRFSRGRRDAVVLASKYGISPPRGSWVVGKLQSPARAAIRTFPSLRTSAKQGAENAIEPHSYGPDVAEASLNRTLRALRTDYLDIFFLHEPRGTEVGRGDEIRGFLEDARAAGKIRAWGVSGESKDSSLVREKLGGAGLLQISDDAFSRLHRNPELTPDMTYGALSEALPLLMAHQPAQTFAGPRGAERIAELLLADARQANPGRVLLFSTGVPSRVAGAVQAMSQPFADAHASELASVRAFVLEASRDLGRMPGC